MKRGFFIVLEGPDRSGKSTQAWLLKTWFERKGYCVVLTREPGGTKVSEQVRKILLDPNNNIERLTELFLYESSRAQHTLEIILPALKSGKVVISDRFTMSTSAYQGYGRGLPLKTVNTLNHIATCGLKPDLIFVFDIPDRIFAERERLAQKLTGPDRIERESAAFRKRVNRAYKIMAQKPGVDRVNGALPVADIQKEIISRVRRLVQGTGHKAQSSGGAVSNGLWPTNGQVTRHNAAVTSHRTQVTSNSASKTQKRKSTRLGKL
ncbi:MAG TPA: dTMP kinase [Elusimicrobia bacterium]|nr:MAG: dTMP kinase [Elusimicrobia bacterium GWA2_51_34]HAF95526.1 dTMP kinase [Elusimicrobiota bacterium]HCE98356.1 dTMP kinase [Elusimicrobiota bacterium]